MTPTAPAHRKTPAVNSTRLNIVFCSITTQRPIRGQHIIVPGQVGLHPLVRAPGILNLATLTTIEVIKVDGEAMATAAAVPMHTYQQRPRLRDRQGNLFPSVGPRTLDHEELGDVIIRSIAAYSLTGDERNPLRGDVYRIALFIYASSRTSIIPESKGARFLTGKYTEAAKRRWWAAVEALRYMVIRVNSRTGEFRDLAMASIKDDGTAVVAPPLWWRGHNAWRLTGGLFRPILVESDETKRGYNMGYWGGLNRTIAGIEAALSWGRTAGRGRDGRIPDLLRPANGRSGPGPELRIPAHQVLILAGEYVQLTGKGKFRRGSREQKRWLRRQAALEQAGYVVPSRNKTAWAGDTIEVVRIVDGRGSKEGSGLVVRASARFVEAVKKAQDPKTWTRLPADMVFPKEDLYP